MAKHSKQSVLFQNLFNKPLHVHADREGQTSDAGLILLSAADRRLELTADLAQGLHDNRDPLRIAHSFTELLRQRVYSVAAGYEDANDAAKMRHDPALAVAVGKIRPNESPLASQPSISRFENSVSARDVSLMGRKIEDVAVKQLKRQQPKKRRPRIIIDLDPSLDRAHGAQQGVLFNGAYRSWCFLPMFGFVSFEGEPSQLLFSARLRPGNSREMRATIPLLKRFVAKLREKFGRRQGILVRLDAGFQGPRLLEELEALKVSYVIGMPTNAVLKRSVAERMPAIVEQAEESGVTTREFTECQYLARHWTRKRRLVTKIEAIPYPGRKTEENPRHFLTNLRACPERVHAIYCKRGDAENRIKELKHGLAVDRTSCTRFVANQLRVLIAATAFVLFQEIRWRARRKLGRIQVSRMIMMLVKVSGQVIESTRRITVHLPKSYPFQEEWMATARACGALPG